MSFQLQSNVDQLTKQMQQRAAKLVSNTAHNLESRMRLSMAEAKHGHKYGNHTSSAPGESPAVDTGFLTNSIQVEANGLNAIVGTNAEYAEHLEFGTAFIAPRPFFDPAFEDERPVFEKGLRELAK